MKVSISFTLTCCAAMINVVGISPRRRMEICYRLKSSLHDWKLMNAVYVTSLNYLKGVITDKSNSVSLFSETVRIITVTSKWARWRFKSLASRLFTQPFFQAQIKENTKAPRHWPLWGNHRWPMNSPHKGPVTRRMLLFDDVIMHIALPDGGHYQDYSPVTK